MGEPSDRNSIVPDASPSGGPHRRREAATSALKSTFILLCIAVLFLLAVSRLLFPLEGDGALFLTAATMMDDGGVLYVDFWDVKQPGIFYFFFMAGRVFGFTFEGLQLFQAGYWACLGALIYFYARPYLVRPWLAIFGPFAFLGTYYAHAPMGYHAQVEIVASGPILLTAVFLANGGKATGVDRYLRLALAGLFGAFVVALKLALAPILVALFLVHAASCLRRTSAVSTIVRDAGAVFVGGTSVLLAMALALHWEGGLGGALETAFLVGPDWALNAPEAPVSRLMGGAVSFLDAVGLWAGFALIGLAGGWSPKRRYLVWQCVAWVAAAVVCILIQRFSWWPYQWQLLYLPVALLAVLGADVCLDWLERRMGVSQRAGIVLAVVASLPILAGYLQVTAGRFLLLEAHRDEIAQGDFEGFRADVSRIYAEATEIANAIPPTVDPATVYVMGDPLVYVVLGKVQAVPVNGWALEFFSPLSWARLTQELSEGRPEAILVMPYYEDILDQKAPAIRNLLDTSYSRGPQLPLGDWYFLEETRS